MQHSRYIRHICDEIGLFFHNCLNLWQKGLIPFLFRLTLDNQFFHFCIFVLFHLSPIKGVSGNFYISWNIYVNFLSAPKAL